MNVFSSREPEVVQAEADKHHGGDTEKVATVAAKGPHLHAGVKLVSRYDKAGELNLMAEMVNFLRDHGVYNVDQIFCDSKATSHFVLTASKLRPNEAEAIASLVHAFLLSENGGHNGIIIENASQTVLAEADPDWNDWR